MKTGKRKRCLLLVLMLLMQSMPAHAAEKEKPLEKVLEYESEDPDEKREFDRTLTADGKTYRLKDVEYRAVRKKEKKTVSMTETSRPVLPDEAYDFLNRLTKDGVVYTLKEVREKETEPYTQEVFAYTDYDHPVTAASVPAQKSASVMNEKTGQEEQTECRLTGVRQTDRRTWVNSDIDIKVQGYDSNSILWQGMEIPNDMGDTPLKGYEAQLLRSVGLHAGTGKVLRTYWTSGAYGDADGTICRNAKADILKNVPVYRAEYKGVLETPMTVREAVYEGEEETESRNVYVVTARAVYERSMLPYVMAGAGIFLAVILTVGILMILKKRKREKTNAST